MKSLAEIEQRLDALEAGGSGPEAAVELVELGEAVLEHWVHARDLVPTQETREGFRLLALHLSLIHISEPTRPY